MKPELRQALKILKEEGVTVESWSVTSHFRIVTNVGKITAPSSPSDVRWKKNFRARVRRKIRLAKGGDA